MGGHFSINGLEILNFFQKAKIKNKKFFIIDFNILSKKPLKKVISSHNAKRLNNNEIEKIIRFGLNSHEL